MTKEKRIKPDRSQFYLGNPNLPTTSAQFEYKPENVSEGIKCAKDLIYFAENYFFIINGDTGRGLIKLHEYQRSALKMLQDNRFSLLLFSRQVGKALALDTPVCTSAGWSTIGEIKAGDKVYDTEGKWCDVVYAHNILHERGCYRITFNGSEQITADGEHQWFTQTLQERANNIAGSVKTTKEILKTLTVDGILNHRVPRAKNIDTSFKHRWHYIKNIVPVDSVPVRCLTVNSKDSLFLVGKTMVPTHNTTIATIFCLWIACFNSDQNILIVANKESTAKEILKRVKLAYEELPGWLKPATVKYKEESVELGNGSKLGITTTTGSAGRGISANILFVDEADWIDSGLLKEFWASVFPIISSMTTSKIVMASTPRDTSGLFYQLYSGSVEGTNSWKHMKIIWSDVPGRDEKWKKEIIGSLADPSSFQREFECQFAETGESVLDLDLFEKMQRRCIEAPFVYMDGAYKMWMQPSSDRVYTVGVDIAEGIGKDSTVIQVFDITDLRQITQVAIYSNNTITPLMFTAKLNEILQHWGSPPVLIERNGCGAVVVDNLKKDFNYSNIVSYGAKEASRNNIQNGVISHTNTKYECITNQRYWINTLDAVIIYDIHTLSELRSFIRGSNGTWKAAPGKHDDRVMSMGWSLMILHDKLVSRYFDVLAHDDNKKPLVIKPFAYEANHIAKPSGLYTNEVGNHDVLPTIFGFSRADDELADLSLEGWQMLSFD